MRKYLFLLPVLAVAACGPSDRCEAPSQPKLLAVKDLILVQKADATIEVISEGTVKAHVKAILRKLEARDRTQAISIAMKRGLVRSV